MLLNCKKSKEQQSALFDYLTLSNWALTLSFLPCSIFTLLEELLFLLLVYYKLSKGTRKEIYAFELDLVHSLFCGANLADLTMLFLFNYTGHTNYYCWMPKLLQRSIALLVHYRLAPFSLFHLAQLSITLLTVLLFPQSVIFHWPSLDWTAFLHTVSFYSSVDIAFGIKQTLQIASHVEKIQLAFYWPSYFTLLEDSMSRFALLWVISSCSRLFILAYRS